MCAFGVPCGVFSTYLLEQWSNQDDLKWNSVNWYICNAFPYLNHVDCTIIGRDIVLLRYQGGRHVLTTIFLSKLCIFILPLLPALCADWLLTDGASRS
jgi:hypothetical protein